MKPSQERALRRIFGERIDFRPETLLAHSYDATRESRPPEAVFFAESEEDIARLLRFALEEKIPVVPRGAGVGYSGGAIPVAGGIVLALNRFNRILQIDSGNFQAVVEPGVVTADLQKAVSGQRLFYPPDPASQLNSTIGGNVAENAGGPRCFKYGVTADYVLALEALLMGGEKIHAGSRALKDVAGYNLKSLLIGSEGTLAVITKIVLKLLPAPESRILFEIDFNSLERAAEFVLQVIYRRIQPSALEFIDETALRAAFSYLKLDYPAACGARILIELDGSPEELALREARLQELMAEEGLSGRSAAESSAIEKLWEIRRSISPAITGLKPKKINEDIAVPIAAIPETVRYIKESCKREGLTVVLFGHIGDGNIHTNILIDPSKHGEEERAERLLEEIFNRVCSRHGTISGEHGIGIAKKRFLRQQYSPGEIGLFRKIKHVFDPENLLNPGKIF